MEQSSFLSELRRRRVLRVSGFYVAIAWATTEFSATVFPSLHLPDWTVTVVILLLIFGFPICVLVAWFFDVGAGGIERTEDIGSGSRAQFALLISGSVVVSALGAMAAFHVYRSEVAEPAPARSSTTYPLTAIAVLPFNNFSGDAETGYFADGLSEELSARLARAEGLQVAARTSAFLFKDNKVPVEEIAAQLRVGSVLEGSVRQSGDNLRITAQLINAGSGFHLWAASYDRKLEDIFEIQNDIAHSVVAALEVLLADSNYDTRQAAPRATPRDYGVYLKARGYLRASATEDSLAKASALFTQTIENAPLFAPAYAGLCETLLVHYRFAKTPELVPMAEQACRTALAIDSTASAVQTALGDLHLVKGQNLQALRAFDAALGLDPNEVGAYRGLANANAALGNNGLAEDHYLKAIELQPGYWRPLSDYARFLVGLGRYDDAIGNFEAAADLNPGSASVYNNLGAAHYINGQFAPAAEAYRRSLAIRPTRSAYSNTGAMYYYASRFEEARDMFEQATELAPDDYRTWGNLADARAQIHGMSATTRAAYAEADRLLLAAMRVNPSDASLQARAAWMRVNLQDESGARQLISSAKSLSPQDAQVFYNAALIAVRLGDLESALADIARAIELGLSPKVVAATPELTSLRGNSEFLKLVGAEATNRENARTGE